MDANFVDYFSICGLNVDEELVEERLNDCSVSSKPPLDRSYLPAVLAHYPKHRPERPFAQEILSLCLPRGLRFCTQKNLTNKPSFHTFVCIRMDGSRLDGCALTFYEKVKDEKVMQKMQALHNTYLRELTAGKAPDSTANMEDSPTRAKLMEEHVGGSSAHTLPRRGKSSSKKRFSFYDSNHDKLYVCKCIALITKLPVVSACESLLTAIYSLTKESELQLPLESYVYWLLYELPLPPPGLSLKLTLLDRDVVFQCPSTKELPFFDYPIGNALSIITVELFVKIYTCVLLERQVLFCSKELYLLMLFAETFQILLFPFRWQHVYVPILPCSQFVFLEAPLPFIMGLWYEETIPENIFELNVCVVDIDNKHVVLPEGVPMLPDRAELIQQLHLSVEIWNGHTGRNLSISEHNADHRSEPSSLSTTEARTATATMTTTSTASSSATALKRISRSFDDDSLYMRGAVDSVGGAGLDPAAVDAEEQIALPLNVLNESESLARLTAIARKVHVDISLDLVKKELVSSSLYQLSPSCRYYFDHMKLNSLIRAVFLNRFMSTMYSYEHFIVNCCRDRDSFVSSRDSMQNFDKSTFLSDQPQSRMPFLAAFLETQMFTSFIDAKILAEWDQPDPFVKLFDSCLADYRQKNDDTIVRTPNCEFDPHLLLAGVLLFSIFAFAIRFCFILLDFFFPTDMEIENRERSVDYVIPAPHLLTNSKNQCFSLGEPGTFPLLNADLLEPQARQQKRNPWKQRYRHLIVNDIGGSNISQRSDSSDPTYQIIIHPGVELKVDDFTQKNSKIVEKLLLLAKTKTKRLLLEKLGKEAVQLGHDNSGIGGVEENTLVTSLCDMIERIWHHGCKRKKGKSALWSYLLAFQNLDKFNDKDSSGMRSRLTPGSSSPQSIIGYLQSVHNKLDADQKHWSNNLLRAANFFYFKLQSSVDNIPNIVCQCDVDVNAGDLATWSSSGPTATGVGGSEHVRSSSVEPQRSSGTGSGSSSSSRPRSPESVQLMRALPNHLEYDLSNVLKMTDIKTEIGYARAFIRLALERKLLCKHLKTLLESKDLLKSWYKQYAFLMHDDEREQFLYHILSLNAADFHCFTNTFRQTKITYQVNLAYVSGRFSFTAGGQPSIWIRLAGSLHQTGVIAVPKNTSSFTFEHKNLGILSTLHIGNDVSASAQSTVKWYLEYAIVTDQITGRSYKFSCGRWFGRGVGDDSLERFFSAEPLPLTVNSGNRSPTRSRSSSSRRTPSHDHPKRRLQQIQHQLGDAVNNIVKYFYRPDAERNVLTHLLCGEKGLVSCLNEAFLLGYRGAPRLFRQSYFAWDFVEKFASCCAEFSKKKSFRQDKYDAWFLSVSKNQAAVAGDDGFLLIYLRRLVEKINGNTGVGKEGKFKIFVLVALRDHLLPSVISLMARSSITTSIYMTSLPGNLTSQPDHRFYQLLTALFFGTTSSLIVFVNKFILTNYRFPSLTFVGLGQLAGTVSIVCLWNAFYCKNGHLSFGSLKKLFPLPLIYLLNLLSGLGSTKALNLPMFVVMRRFALLFTMIGEFIFLGYRFNRSVKLAIFLMILGAIVAAVNDIYIDIIGCGYVLFNDLMTAANTICVKEKMNSVNLPKNDMLFYNAVCSLPILLCYCLLVDDLNEIIYFEFWKDWVFLSLFCCSCVGGYLLNMSTILCTHFNSPLTTSCIGTIKNIFITYIGMVCTSDYAFSWPSFLGIHISLCGSLVYTIQAILPSKMTWSSDSTQVYPVVRTC
ncbi:DENN domain-containing protein 5A [Trichinella zimbabwensis]|uniref:DENN domain-containing protein 5A n=1 Tax=Trichinella zimbabwensis TaxID=268475 RepID=A0A0V1H7Q3_9BILA|nr:DENN domain-containing protein 5A [Trichinella zimbabwensis]